MRIGCKDMDLHEEQKRKFEEFINNKWPEPQTCPICRDQHWSILDFISEVKEMAPRDKKAVRTTPVIQLLCENCGYTILFNAFVADIYENNLKALDETGKSRTTKDSTSKT